MVKSEGWMVIWTDEQPLAKIATMVFRPKKRMINLKIA